MSGRMTWPYASSRPLTSPPASPPAKEYASDEGSWSAENPMPAEEIVGLEEELSYGGPSPITASPVSVMASPATDLSPNGPTSSTPWAPPIPSTKYWFSDGSVVIKESSTRYIDQYSTYLLALQVNATLYKVHKSIMTQQSCFFQEELTAQTPPPPPPLKSKKGKKIVNTCPITLHTIGSLENPLVLPNVTSSGFELVLSFIYPIDYRTQYDLTVHEWANVVNTSTTLQLASIRAVAINSILKHASPLDLIDLGLQCSIPECLREGFRQICVREESLSLEEGLSLGVTSIIKIAHAREMIARGSTWSQLEKEFDS